MPPKKKNNARAEKLKKLYFSEEEQQQPQQQEKEKMKEKKRKTPPESKYEKIRRQKTELLQKFGKETERKSSEQQPKSVEKDEKNDENEKNDDETFICPTCDFPCLTTESRCKGCGRPKIWRHIIDDESVPDAQLWDGGRARAKRKAKAAADEKEKKKDDDGDDDAEIDEAEYERIATTKPAAQELALMPTWKMFSDAKGSIPKFSLEKTLVHFVFQESIMGWLWLATHWDASQKWFYGYVIMYEREWGPFEIPALTHVLIRLPSIERKLPLPVAKVLKLLHREESGAVACMVTATTAAKMATKIAE